MRDERIHEGAGREGWVSTVAAFLGIVVVVVFLPLGIAAVEYFGFGTSYFEDWLRKLGVHDALSIIYRPIGDFIRWVRHRA